MKPLFLTDLHLDHAQPAVVEAFYQTIRDAAPTHIFITGDTGTSYNIRKYLKELSSFGAPVYAVLGNHDFWGSSIHHVRKMVTNLSKQMEGTFHYLSTTAGHTPLDDTTAIIGHDGWYDARCGDPQPRHFLMHDWKAISDFDKHTSFYFPNFDRDVIRISQGLAAEAVEHVHRQLQSAVEAGFKKISVLTHFPPWPEVSLHRGRPNDAIAAPWYVSRIMGEFLRCQAVALPDVQFTVLCGHTHGQADYHPLDNLHCYVGHSEYGTPAIQRDVFEQKPVDQESAAE